MGRYEEAKERRKSAPVTSSSSGDQPPAPGGRRWSGGLLPLPTAGCYGQPPAPASVASSRERRARTKTYSAYSVSRWGYCLWPGGDICHENTVAVTAWCTAPRWRGQRRASAGGAAPPQLQVLVTGPGNTTSLGFILSIKSRIESE